MRIAMLLYNDFVQDLRVHKEARDLAGHGHEIVVVSTRTRFDLPEREERSGYALQRLPISGRLRTEIRPALQHVTASGSTSLAARVVDSVRRHPIRRRWAVERARSYFGRRALAFVERWRPDAVHAHDLDMLDFGAEAATRLGVPLVYDSHELWRENNFINKQPARVRERWRKREEAHVRKARAVILTTESRAEQFKRWYPGIEPVVVMNCQDGTPVDRTNLLRERFGLDPERVILLYQGLIHADRGIYVALDALPRLPERFVFVAIGQGTDAPAFQREITARGLAARAFYHAPVHHDDLAAVTASADYGIGLVQNTSLSYYLSAPNKLFEFMRAGLPVVASDFPEVRRVFEAGDIGERIDPADPAALAAAVLRLDGDPERRARIAITARRLVRDTFNWQNQVVRLLAIYDAIAASR